VKLITYAADNPARGLPAILGDVLVMRASTGERLALLDGPALTARRTAAVTLYAARALAPLPTGAGCWCWAPEWQALAHVLAFTEALGVDEVWVRGRHEAASLGSRSVHQRGLYAEPAGDLACGAATLPAGGDRDDRAGHLLRGSVRDDAFVAAIGAFTPQMIELDPALTRDIAARGQVVIDSASARHEAGDLLAAGLDLSTLATLAEHPPRRDGGPVLFKSCGSALWDLAAARCVAA